MSGYIHYIFYYSTFFDKPGQGTRGSITVFTDSTHSRIDIFPIFVANTVLVSLVCSCYD